MAPTVLMVYSDCLRDLNEDPVDGIYSSSTKIVGSRALNGERHRERQRVNAPLSECNAQRSTHGRQP